MADKEKAPEAGGEGAEETKKSKLPLIIGIVVALAVVGGGGAFAYFKFAAAPKPAADQAAEAEPVEREQATVIVPLTSFVVNLEDPTGRRYLKTTMSLELNHEDGGAELNKKMAQIRDAVIVLLSSKTLEDVTSTKGKFQIRKEVGYRVNKFLKDVIVLNVYFTEFVVQ
ncbi:MAG: flagellar basal body-associated FliL family protein [Myxococcales bacterium]|nr:flagellar basal body-associated FliL family protein [Myxococcales bacterium]